MFGLRELQGQARDPIPRVFQKDLSERLKQGEISGYASVMMFKKNQLSSTSR